ncbi:MAG: TetR/AcrR family transcriptional regulator [Solirubrobacterales bacterium]|nr:TetR/AcrR family transcriptional regulator [Solirubrobacterales bacterium]
MAGLGHERLASQSDETRDELPRSLRDQHHELTRELIMRAVIKRLEENGFAELTVPEVARASGVSLRTVYRHFPTRDDLLVGATEWIAANYFAIGELPDNLDGVMEQLVANAKTWDEHPELVRTMALTRVGNAVRSVRRVRRLERLREALREVTANLSDAERRRAEGVFGHLNNMLAWVTMRDENGMSGEEVGEALRRAMETLIEHLRRRNEAAAKARTNKRGPGGSSAT